MVEVNVKLFCPNCGARMIVIAHRRVRSENLQSRLGEIISDRWKKAMSGQKAFLYGFGKDIMFVACAKCEKLFLYYYDEGHHFDFAGKLTDEVSTMILTCLLEAEDEK
ncbi:hypothetical protein J7K27_10740 [Candidatus Bathyarchaeota archaeon]|nr:hypothetical protein [Candidatus Bathyarchaeota archaeon]